MVRFRLLFDKGPLFYANLNFRLFFFLIRSKVDIIVSNDLDTLTACYLASGIIRKKLIFDSHELFHEVPELVHRPHIRKIWLMLEKLMVRRIDAGFTVCKPIADYYENRYNVSFGVIRNLSRYKPRLSPIELVRNQNPAVIIYQGVLNLGRGLELAIESMKYISNASLWIIGDGDVRDQLLKLTKDKGLTEKVEFIGRIPLEELDQYTQHASIGLSLEENLGLNYQYALPNKLFDYIQARMPVIVSDLPEMKAIVEKYGIGSILINRTPQALAEIINTLLQKTPSDKTFIDKIEFAANELCWEKEEIKLLDIFKNVRNSNARNTL
jgi:glycosyltransferase involved in cell wall biosynthesis